MARSQDALASNDEARSGIRRRTRGAAPGVPAHLLLAEPLTRKVQIVGAAEELEVCRRRRAAECVRLYVLELELVLRAAALAVGADEGAAVPVALLHGPAHRTRDVAGRARVALPFGLRFGLRFAGRGLRKVRRTGGLRRAVLPGVAGLERLLHRVEEDRFEVAVRDLVAEHRLQL